MDVTVLTEVQKAFEQLGKTINRCGVGAVSVEEGVSVTSKIEQLSHSINLLQTSILLLKAEDRERRVSEDRQFNTFDSITEDLNNKIEMNILQEIALKTAVRSKIMSQIANDNAALISQDLTSATESDGPEVRILGLIGSQLLVLDELQKSRRLLNNKYVEEMENKKELLLEMNSFVGILQSQKEELDRKADDTSENPIMASLHTTLEKVNITRMLIGRLLVISGVNFMEKPKWMKLLLQCRKPITLASLQS